LEASQAAALARCTRIGSELRAITPLVVPSDLPFRNPGDGEFFLSGLRLAKSRPGRRRHGEVSSDPFINCRADRQYCGN
jgi:hypothetical protein